MRSFLPLAFLILPLLSISPAFGQVSVQSRSSLIGASDFLVDGSGPSDFQLFTALGNFNSTGTVSTASGIDVITTQNSTVTNALFEIETFSDGGIATDFFTESLTSLFVEFDVTSPVTYSLEGTLTEEINNSFGSIFFTLRGASFGSPTLFSISSIDQTDFSDSGVLPVGSYVFDFNATYLSDFPDRGAIASSDVSLTFATIPEPSALVLLVGLVAATATQRNRA